MAKKRTKAAKQHAQAKRLDQVTVPQERQKKTFDIMADIDLPQIQRDLLKTTAVTVIVLAVLYAVLRYT